MQCEDCIKYKRINKSQIRPKMINNTEHVLSPEAILEIDILPNLPNSAGYQNIVTMIDVLSRYLFAYPTQDSTAKTIGRCIVDVMTRHAYLAALILSAKGSQIRVYEARTNYRNFRKDSCFNQNCAKNFDRRKTFSVAQISSDCGHEL